MKPTLENHRDWKAHWDNAVARNGETEFLRQVERTVGGQPMETDQIDLTVHAVSTALKLTGSDILVDLCCGNGLLTSRLAELSAHVIGLDFSDELIAIARAHFQRPNIEYVVGTAVELDAPELAAVRPTAFSMITALQHFTMGMFTRMLERLDALAGGNARAYFTDVPDIDGLDAFYNTAERQADFARRRAAGTEAIGTWWNKSELIDSCRQLGYIAEFPTVDARRFSAHYRFDMLVSRP